MAIEDNTKKLVFNRYSEVKQMPDDLELAIMMMEFNHPDCAFFIYDKTQQTFFGIQRTETIALIDEAPLLHFIYRVESGDNSDIGHIDLRAKENQYLINNSLNIHCYETKSDSPREIGMAMQFGENVLDICAGVNVNGGLQSKITRAVHMYRVFCNDDNKILEFIKFMNMMNLNAITTIDRFTVLPYPFKYLREYKKMLLWDKVRKTQETPSKN